MLNRDYLVTAGALAWKVGWEREEELGIVFFDFPEGMSIYGGSGSDNLARAVFSISFRLEKSGESFVEKSVTAEDVRHARAPN
jgi:hypothetical protein